MPTREQILTAAIDVYAQHGFRGATTRRIADAAGVNEVTVFRHFGSKDALLAEAISHAASEGPALRLPAEPRDPRVELTEWAQAQLTHLRTRSSMIRTCMGELEERPELTNCAASPPRAAFDELSGYLRTLSSSGFAKEEFDDCAAAAMLMGVLFADAMSRDLVPEIFPPAADAATAYVSLLLGALGIETTESSVVQASPPPFVPDATGA